jgi:acyl-CoA thioesterase-1
MRALAAGRRRALTAATLLLVSAAARPAAEGPVVVFLGDSLTAGYGLGEEMAFPALVGQHLSAEGVDVRIVNAGVSGDTTAGGLARLDWLLGLEPVLVVVGLGANDGLRGLDLTATERNLAQIVRRCGAAGAAVLLLGMRMPPNYGPYGVEFAAIYPRLANEIAVDLVPFLLEGVGGDPALNLRDGIHPNEEGQRRLAATVLPAVRTLLARRGGG